MVPGDVCMVLGGCVHGPRVHGPGGVPGRDPPMATAAGGTHPTGMHSCCALNGTR